MMYDAAPGEKSAEKNMTRLSAASAPFKQREESAGKPANPEHEPEIVPPARMRIGVNSDMVGEKAYEERDRGDEAVPQSFPETGPFLDKRQDMGLRRGAGNEKRRGEGNRAEQRDFESASHGGSFRRLRGACDTMGIEQITYLAGQKQEHLPPAGARCAATFERDVLIRQTSGIPRIFEAAFTGQLQTTRIPCGGGSLWILKIEA
jgi:hypothetical protein